MSNSEPSAIVLHGIPCIGGLYISFDSNGENGSLNSEKVRREAAMVEDDFIPKNDALPDFGSNQGNVSIPRAAANSYPDLTRTTQTP
jgi:hypothetical protein